MSTITVTIGLPACGKSYHYEDGQHKRYGAVRLSSDEVRKDLFGDESDQTAPEYVFYLMQKRLTKFLREGKDVYVDATHLREDWRKYIFEAVTIAEEVYKVPTPHIRALVFTPYFSDIYKLWKRDKKRSRSVGLRALLRMYFKYQKPTLEEGFDEIVYAFNPEWKVVDGKIIVTEE